MIPAIGLIIGMYVIVRYLSFLGSKTENILVKVCSVLALILTVLCLVDILISGSKMPLPR